ncbi:MAG: nitrilase-related carbon-nitrogen hydrolase, partial [Gaiellaceae bacterium]
MRLALAQINAVVGDLEGNRERILAAVADARAANADLVLLPELAVTGYPPEDLLLRPAFVRAAEESTRAIAAACTGITALVGTPWSFDGALANVCAVCADGEIRALYRKRLLPNYGVFDEARYFAPGADPLVLPAGGLRVGLTVCEDVWQPGPAADLAAAGAELLVNISASPFHVGKAEEREAMLAGRARDNGFPLA